MFKGTPLTSIDVETQLIPWVKEQVKTLQAERNTHTAGTKEWKRLYFKINQLLDTLEIVEGYVRGQMGTVDPESSGTR